jgi:hypothetical protein
LIITLLGERPRSWNLYYSVSSHWSIRAKEAKRIHELVRYTVMEQHPQVEMFEGRVSITFRAYFDKRPIDPDNLVAKIYIDGLIGILIKDDSWKYVAGVTLESHIDRDTPRVELEVVNE